MKKASFVFLLSNLFFALACGVLCAASKITRPLAIEGKWWSIGIGSVFLIIGTVFAIIAKKDLFKNALWLFFNAFSLSFFLHAWMLYRETTYALLPLLIVSVTVSSVLWLFYFLLFIPVFERHLYATLLIFFLLLLIGGIVLSIVTASRYFPILCYELLVECFFAIAFCTEKTSLTDVFRRICLSSLGVFYVGVIVVLCIADGDGDFLELFTTDFSDILSSPKTNRPPSPKI